MQKRHTQKNQKAFASIVRERRNELGLSQEELAGRCVLHRTYIADIERGCRNPSLNTIILIVNGLGLSLEDFFAKMDERLTSSAKGEG